MVYLVRKEFNEAFTNDKYNSFLGEIDKFYPSAIDFRLAETPVFIQKDFAAKMFEACENIIDLIKDPAFLSLTERAIPASDKVPGEYGYPQMIAFDFGICTNSEGAPEPQLVKMQGFPSLYGFQSFLPGSAKKLFPHPRKLQSVSWRAHTRKLCYTFEGNNLRKPSTRKCYSSRNKTS